MPEGPAPVETLAERIAELQSAARAAGRDRIHVAVFGPPPRLDAFSRLSAIGARRAVRKARPKMQKRWSGFWTVVEPFIDAVAKR
jgi:nicotinamidase-related amidase